LNSEINSGQVPLGIPYGILFQNLLSHFNNIVDSETSLPTGRQVQDNILDGAVNFWFRIDIVSMMW